MVHNRNSCRRTPGHQRPRARTNRHSACISCHSPIAKRLISAAKFDSAPVAQLFENTSEISPRLALNAPDAFSTLAVLAPKSRQLRDSRLQVVENTPKTQFLIAVWKIRTTLQP
ncbi:MAG: hypothetical protein WBD66_15920, partial [Candidatus Acidiferrales bacterium]